MKWKIYYDGGASFSNEDGSPEQAPKHGVLIIVQDHPDVGRYMLDRMDFYWWDRGQWLGGDLAGLFDHLAQSGVRGPVIFGRHVPTPEYKRAWYEGRGDPYFKPKSAWLPGERREP